MKKKLTKIIENSLPQLFDKDGEVISRRQIANKIYDSIPNVEKLDLEPFHTYIPFICSSCRFNQAYKMGCTYLMFSEQYHKDNPIPETCPLGYRN